MVTVAEDSLNAGEQIDNSIASMIMFTFYGLQ